MGPVIPASSQAILARLGDMTPIGERRLPAEGVWRSSGTRVVSTGQPLWPRAESRPADESTSAVTPPVVAATASGASHVMSDDSKTSPAPAAAPAAGTTAHVPGATPVPEAARPQAASVADAAITIDDFVKVELKVGKVLAAESVPKSKKLLKLTVQDGTDTERTILAGIAESYTPETIVGRSIVFVANLAPRPMMGLVSHGMVLAADTDGKAQLIGFETPPAPGTRVR
jgi:methionyl-tRNA synthetase